MAQVNTKDRAMVLLTGGNIDGYYGTWESIAQAESFILDDLGLPSIFNGTTIGVENPTTKKITEYLRENGAWVAKTDAEGITYTAKASGGFADAESAHAAGSVGKVIAKLKADVSALNEQLNPSTPASPEATPLNLRSYISSGSKYYPNRVSSYNYDGQPVVRRCYGWQGVEYVVFKVADVDMYLMYTQDEEDDEAATDVCTFYGQFTNASLPEHAKTHYELNSYVLKTDLQGITKYKVGEPNTRNIPNPTDGSIYYNLGNVNTVITVSSVMSAEYEVVITFTAQEGFSLAASTSQKVVGELDFETNKSYVLAIFAGTIVSAERTNYTS